MERFNKTLKQMFKKVMDIDGKNWDQLLLTYYSPSAKHPKQRRVFRPSSCYMGEDQDLLDLAKEAWESRPSTHRIMVDHVEQVRDRMAQVILQHQDVFSEVPGRTTVAQHDIRTAPGIPRGDRQNAPAPCHRGVTQRLV